MKILKKISIKDILGIFIFVILIIPAFIRKHILKKELWLVCEHLTARDNGYFFFKYMRENHPEIDCYYAIDYKHNDFEKVKPLGNTVKWGSLKHYYYYMSATQNVVAHKNGNPNHMVFSLLLKYLKLYNNVTFLQHGVLYQNFEMFHKKNCYFKNFVCGAKPEYEFVNKKFGYDKNEVKYTGLARFDNLHNTKPNKKIILYMPTWRRYLADKDELEHSNYYKKIMSFINSKELEELLLKNKMELYFCPHNGLNKGMDLFYSKNKNVKIIDISKADIQELLISGSILITDFSSLHTDFAYMNKPIIYYQYDKDDYNKKHVGPSYKDTYYSFEKDGFGKVTSTEDKLIEELDRIIKRGVCPEDKYIKRTKAFFELHDNKNCERIYKMVKGD